MFVLKLSGIQRELYQNLTIKQGGNNHNFRDRKAWLHQR